jgi:hypothetical protein
VKNLVNENSENGKSAPNSGGNGKLRPKEILAPVILTGNKTLRYNEWPGSPDKGGPYRTIELSEKVPLEQIVKDAERAEGMTGGYGYRRIRLFANDLPILVKGIEAIIAKEST